MMKRQRMLDILALAAIMAVLILLVITLAVVGTSPEGAVGLISK
jgi:hypothetical protein